MTGYNMCW